MAKKEFTEEQMREFSKNAIPFITQLKEVAEHFGVSDDDVIKAIFSYIVADAKGKYILNNKLEEEKQ